MRPVSPFKCSRSAYSPVPLNMRPTGQRPVWAATRTCQGARGRWPLRNFNALEPLCRREPEDRLDPRPTADILSASFLEIRRTCSGRWEVQMFTKKDNREYFSTGAAALVGCPCSVKKSNSSGMPCSNLPSKARCRASRGKHTKPEAGAAPSSGTGGASSSSLELNIESSSLRVAKTTSGAPPPERYVAVASSGCVQRSQVSTATSSLSKCSERPCFSRSFPDCRNCVHNSAPSTERRAVGVG
mmetsp:Transcript_61394/g.155933  ORF Transcript_61394/g.155933 Transcript_61394/m.155933 type:complete len:243 (-) Transcript_61394:276-1004(-)